MASSWGAVAHHWPVSHPLLPEIVEPGTVIGYWKTKAPMYVALGDLKYSVFRYQPKKNEGIMNISTSAQLALVAERSSNVQEKVRPSPSSMRVAHFQSKDLVVAASLNSGNVLAAFVRLIHSWQASLTNDTSSLPLERLWTRLLKPGLQSISTIEHFSAALFGERHDPPMSAPILNVRYAAGSYEIYSRCSATSRW